MNLRDLQYFVSCDTLKNFSKAAEACFVSQPALSMQLKKLEGELGVQLLERSTQMVLTTEMGKKILPLATEILSLAAEIKALAKSEKEDAEQTIKIGILPTIAPYLLPQAIPKLQNAFPHLKTYLTEEKTQTLLEKVHAGTLDAAIIALPFQTDTLSVMPLFDDPFLLAAAPDHALARLKKASLSALTGQTLLLLEEGHCLREQALDACKTTSLGPTSLFQTNNLETLRYMVESNIGITLMPKIACTPSKAICYIPFEKPEPFRTVALVYRSTSSKQALLTKLTPFFMAVRP